MRAPDYSRPYLDPRYQRRRARALWLRSIPRRAARAAASFWRATGLPGLFLLASVAALACVVRGINHHENEVIPDAAGYLCARKDQILRPPAFTDGVCGATCAGNFDHQFERRKCLTDFCGYELRCPDTTTQGATP